MNTLRASGKELPSRTTKLGSSSVEAEMVVLNKQPFEVMQTFVVKINPKLNALEEPAPKTVYHREVFANSRKKQ